MKLDVISIFQSDILNVLGFISNESNIPYAERIL